MTKNLFLCAVKWFSCLPELFYDDALSYSWLASVGMDWDHEMQSYKNKKSTKYQWWMTSKPLSVSSHQNLSPALPEMCWILTCNHFASIASLQKIWILRWHNEKEPSKDEF